MADASGTRASRALGGGRRVIQAAEEPEEYGPELPPGRAGGRGGASVTGKGGAECWGVSVGLGLAERAALASVLADGSLRAHLETFGPVLDLARSAQHLHVRFAHRRAAEAAAASASTLLKDALTRDPKAPTPTKAGAAEPSVFTKPPPLFQHRTVEEQRSLGLREEDQPIPQANPADEEPSSQSSPKQAEKPAEEAREVEGTETAVEAPKKDQVETVSAPRTGLEGRVVWIWRKKGQKGPKHLPEALLRDTFGPLDEVRESRKGTDLLFPDKTSAGKAARPALIEINGFLYRPRLRSAFYETRKEKLRRTVGQSERSMAAKSREDPAGPPVRCVVLVRPQPARVTLPEADLRKAFPAAAKFHRHAQGVDVEFGSAEAAAAAVANKRGIVGERKCLLYLRPGLSRYALSAPAPPSLRASEPLSSGNTEPLPSLPETPSADQTKQMTAAEPPSRSQDPAPSGPADPRPPFHPAPVKEEPGLAEVEESQPPPKPSEPRPAVKVEAEEEGEEPALASLSDPGRIVWLRQSGGHPAGPTQVQEDVLRANFGPLVQIYEGKKGTELLFPDSVSAAAAAEIKNLDLDGHRYALFLRSTFSKGLKGQALSAQLNSPAPPDQSEPQPANPPKPPPEKPTKSKPKTGQRVVWLRRSGKSSPIPEAKLREAFPAAAKVFQHSRGADLEFASPEAAAAAAQGKVEIGGRMCQLFLRPKLSGNLEELHAARQSSQRTKRQRQASKESSGSEAPSTSLQRLATVSLVPLGPPPQLDLAGSWVGSWQASPHLTSASGPPPDPSQRGLSAQTALLGSLGQLGARLLAHIGPDQGELAGAALEHLAAVGRILRHPDVAGPLSATPWTQ